MTKRSGKPKVRRLKRGEKKEFGLKIGELMKCISATSLYTKTMIRRGIKLDLSRLESELNDASVKLSNAVNMLVHMKYEDSIGKIQKAKRGEKVKSAVFDKSDREEK